MAHAAFSGAKRGFSIVSLIMWYIVFSIYENIFTQRREKIFAHGNEILLDMMMIDRLRREKRKESSSGRRPTSARQSKVAQANQ